MIPNDGFLNSLRQVATEEASIPALRVSVFLFGVFAALAWARRRPPLALLCLSLGGFLGLAYWLIQIVSPLGFGTDPTLAREWAQAGVNALAEPKDSGFVWGTEPGRSLVSTMALAGIPLHLVALIPQAAVLMALGLAILLPFGFLKSRTTATFAACLALGGGIWPGIAPYSAVLIRPSVLLIAGVMLGMLLIAARRRAVCGALNRFRFGISATLVAAASLSHARDGGAELGAAAAVFLSVTAIILASPLRAALRGNTSSPSSARRAEALLLLCVFGGSGLLWWDPPRTIAGFGEARDENAALLRPMEWIRRNVPANSVVLASPMYSAPIAALAGRRVLFSPSEEARAQTSLPEPFRRARLWESARLGRPVARLAEGFSVTHFFLGPGEPSPEAVGEASEGDELRMILVPVYQDVRDFRVFRLVKK